MGSITAWLLAVVVAFHLADAQQLPADGACAGASILMQGVMLNIALQRNEQQALAQVDTALRSGNTQGFQVAKTNLLTTVNNGIAIREMNQLITPPGNKATLGLAKVANAQLEELSLTSGLTGDPKRDLPVVAMLQKDFAGGIMQNMQNAADALAGCAAPANGGAVQNSTTGAPAKKSPNKSKARIPVI